MEQIPEWEQEECVALSPQTITPERFLVSQVIEKSFLSCDTFEFVSHRNWEEIVCASELCTNLSFY